MVLCIIMGIFDIIAGSIFLVAIHDSFVSVIPAISCFISAFIFFYIAYIGKKTSDQGKEITKLKQQMHNDELKIKVLKEHANIDNFDDLVYREKCIELADTPISSLEVGSTLVVIKNLATLDIYIPAGSKVILVGRVQEDYLIKYKIDGKEYDVTCEEKNLQNVYRYDLEHSEPKQKETKKITYK